MQVVIEIDDKLYNRIKYLEPKSNTMLDVLMRSVQNGKLLPKGHGKLKDVDKIISDGTSKGFCNWYDEIKYAPTIIEADKEK